MTSAREAVGSRVATAPRQSCRLRRVLLGDDSPPPVPGVVPYVIRIAPLPAGHSGPSALDRDGGSAHTPAPWLPHITVDPPAAVPGGGARTALVGLRPIAAGDLIADERPSDARHCLRLLGSHRCRRRGHPVRPGARQRSRAVGGAGPSYRRPRAAQRRDSTARGLGRRADGAHPSTAGAGARPRSQDHRGLPRRQPAPGSAAHPRTGARDGQLPRRAVGGGGLRRVPGERARTRRP